MKLTIKNAVDEWLKWDKREETREEIKELVKNNDEIELEKRLFHRMTFGTAGLRARMGAGYSMMNDLTLIQTAQGIREYMIENSAEAEEICGNDLYTGGVVIGYDARFNSKRFANIVANTLLNKNIKVYLFSDICATPHVPFSVLHLKTQWGIMITASHNPKEDNGFKVYYANGAQISAPHDVNIAASILRNLEPEVKSWVEEDTNLFSSPLCVDPYALGVDKKYIERAIKPHCLHYELNKESGPFVYTAMHGVGYKFILQACKAFGATLIPTKLQVLPDPNFPTVKFPNPEEGKSALKLAIETADKNGVDFILANDPDADRLAIAERSNGKWKVFTGNEIGAMFGSWLIARFKESNNNVKMSDVYMISSTVSSKILKSMAAVEGFHHVETLTGYKWMANEADRLLKLGKVVLFTFEEAIGFMIGTTVLDKDGISAAMIAAEMRNYLMAERNVNLTTELENIYNKYGRHISENSYFICHEQQRTDNMFSRLRDYPSPNFQKLNESTKYPSSCGEYKLANIRDLTTGYDSEQVDNKAILPIQAGSHMITFKFCNRCIVTIRTSGTEPKIKYYAEMISAQGITEEELRTQLSNTVKAIVKEFFQPEINNFIARVN